MKNPTGAAPSTSSAATAAAGDPQYNVKVDNKYDLIADSDDPFEAIQRMEKVVKEKPEKPVKSAKKPEKPAVKPAEKAPQKVPEKAATPADKPASAAAPRKPDAPAGDRPQTARGGFAGRGARGARGGAMGGAGGAEGELKAGQNWADHMEQAPVPREVPTPRYDQPSSAGSGFRGGFRGGFGGGFGGGFRGRGGADGFGGFRGRGGPRGGRGARQPDATDAAPGAADPAGVPADGAPADDQAVERTFDNSRRGGGFRGRGFGGGFGGGFRGRGGFRGGRGYGPRPVAGEGDAGFVAGGAEGQGGDVERVQRRGKREFERHSGSDVTGVRAVDKREGAGAHNWGTVKDDMAGQMESVEEGGTEFAPTGKQAGEGQKEGAAEGEAKDAGEAGDKKENEAGDASAEAEGVKTMTLDEYRQNSGVKLAPKPSITQRKPNEGSDSAQWKGLQRLKREPAPAPQEDEADEGGEGGADHARKGRKAKEQTVTDIQIKYVEQPNTRGFGGRGRGRGRGGFGERPAGSAGTFRGAGGREGAAPHIDDERDFPTLGK